MPPIRQEWGIRACESASTGPVPVGCVGAGTGAVSGTIKGGVGSASELLASGMTVAALVAVNSLGSVINRTTGLPWEVHLEVDGEFGSEGRRSVQLPSATAPAPPSNTTLGVIATNAALTKAQAQKIAQMAHDGLARAIRPAHTMFDGDTIFCMATGEHNLKDSEGFFSVPMAEAMNEIGRAVADCMSRAIVRAVLDAHSMGKISAFRDLQSL